MNKQKSSAKPTRSLVLSTFAAWWSTYPKKVAKGAAEKAYAMALQTIVQETTRENSHERQDPVAWLLAKTQLFAASDKGRGDYCPHPATWLLQKRFEDDPSAWRDLASRRDPANGPSSKPVVKSFGTYGSRPCDQPRQVIANELDECRLSLRERIHARMPIAKR